MLSLPWRAKAMRLCKSSVHDAARQAAVMPAAAPVPATPRCDKAMQARLCHRARTLAPRTEGQPAAALRPSEPNARRRVEVCSMVISRRRTQDQEEEAPKGVERAAGGCHALQDNGLRASGDAALGGCCDGGACHQSRLPFVVVPSHSCKRPESCMVVLIVAPVMQLMMCDSTRP